MRQARYLSLWILVAILLTLLVLPACASAPTPTPKPTTPAPAPTTPAAAPKATPSPAPAASPTKSPLPQVPVTYAGDTDASIIRRAQWVEAAKKEGSLVWWDNTDPTTVQKVVAEFNKIYPFIKVDFWCSTGEEMAAKVEAELSAGRSTADSVMGAEMYAIVRWREKGMLEKYVSIVPGVDKMDKRMYSKYGDWVYPASSVNTPQYNTKLVPAADAPKKWEDLLDPKWKGKQVGLTTDVKTWTYLAVEEGGWGLDKTVDFLTKLQKQDVVWQGGHSALHALMIAGETKIAGQGLLYHALNSQKKGAPVEWVRVSPVVVYGSAFSMLKTAPHPNAVKLFAEWLFSPQGLVVYETSSGRTGTAFPGSPSKTAKMLEGLTLCCRTEEGEQKVLDTGLYDRFTKILGIGK